MNRQSSRKGRSIKPAIMGLSPSHACAVRYQSIIWVCSQPRICHGKTMSTYKTILRIKGKQHILGSLRRNLRIGNEDLKGVAYFSLVQLTLDYTAPQFCTPKAKIRSTDWKWCNEKCLNSKIQQQQVPQYQQCFFSMLEHLHWESLESRRTKLPVSRYYQEFSFFPHTIVVWRSLPATAAEASDLVSVKQGLSTPSFY